MSNVASKNSIQLDSVSLLSPYPTSNNFRCKIFFLPPKLYLDMPEVKLRHAAFILYEMMECS